MSGRPGKHPGPLRYAGDPETRGGFRPYLIAFTDWMGAMHYSAHTVKNRRIELGYFIDFTRGNDIYFRPGVYDGSTVDGIALLGHELVHVGQYRNGMNWLTYLWSTRNG